MARNYGFLKLAEEGLLHAKEPLTSMELWELAVKLELVKKLISQGLTPLNSLVSSLTVDCREPDSAFERHPGRPAKFSLKNMERSQE